jgi:hypothetical protein
MPDSKSQTAPSATPATSRLKQAAFPLSILMLVGWGIWTFAFAPAPGWVHMLLTAGVFLLIWAIVARGDALPRGAARRSRR